MPNPTPIDPGAKPQLIEGVHLGMPLAIDELDTPNREYFGHCARHDFHLQRCIDCDLVEYPPRTACMWCGGSSLEWTAVEGRGAVYSYTEVHHAIQPAMRAVAPYLILMVELDAQRGRPGPDDGVRVGGNQSTVRRHRGRRAGAAGARRAGGHRQPHADGLRGRRRGHRAAHVGAR